jgi:hypothetical protein
VQLTSETSTPGVDQTGEFWGGKFIVTQQGGSTVLTLTGPIGPCAPLKATASAVSKPATRTLWGKDSKGNFTTIGKWAGVASRGTFWHSTDSCAGSRATIIEGSILVTDFVSGKTLILSATSATRTYIAKPVLQPVVGKVVRVTPVSGKILVKVPHSKKFVSLTRLSAVPTGSIVDATKGHVKLTVAIGKGRTQSGEFWAGQFIINQTKGKNPTTTLRLTGAFGPCKAPAKKATASAKRRVKSLPPSRSLWGKDSNKKFTTRANYLAAATRGTVWEVVDRCTGSLARVTKGRIVVTDFVHHKKITLKAGKSYFVKKKK